MTFLNIHNNSCRLDKLPRPRNIIFYSIFIILLATISFNFLDKSVADWGYYNTRTSSYHYIWQYATYLQPLYWNASSVYLVYFLVRVYFNKPIELQHKILLLMVISMAFTLIFNEQLRCIFGRYWPSTWFHGNLSWISHKAYGFTWFKLQHEYKSFPSGHTSMIFACMMVLWWLYPGNIKIKVFVVANCLAVAIGLILMCYHFLSDVLIGSLVGTLVSYFIIYSLSEYCRSNNEKK